MDGEVGTERVGILENDSLFHFREKNQPHLKSVDKKSESISGRSASGVGAVGGAEIHGWRRSKDWREYSTRVTEQRLWPNILTFGSRTERQIPPKARNGAPEILMVSAKSFTVRCGAVQTTKNRTSGAVLTHWP